MDKRNIIRFIKNTLLFLLGVCLLAWGHYSNEQYKELHDIDATSGATELAE